MFIFTKGNLDYNQSIGNIGPRNVDNIIRNQDLTDYDKLERLGWIPGNIRWDPTVKYTFDRFGFVYTL